jgi:hypothetical protein
LKQISHEIFSDFLPSEAKISDDRGVSGDPTEISDPFFKSPTVGLQKKKNRLIIFNSKKVMKNVNNISSFFYIL